MTNQPDKWGKTFDSSPAAGQATAITLQLVAVVSGMNGEIMLTRRRPFHFDKKNIDKKETHIFSSKSSFVFFFHISKLHHKLWIFVWFLFIWPNLATTAQHWVLLEFSFQRYVGGERGGLRLVSFIFTCNVNTCVKIPRPFKNQHHHPTTNAALNNSDVREDEKKNSTIWIWLVAYNYAMEAWPPTSCMSVHQTAYVIWFASVLADFFCLYFSVLFRSP